MKKVVRHHTFAAAAALVLCLCSASGAPAAATLGGSASTERVTLAGHVLPALAVATPVITAAQKSQAAAAEAEPELTLTVVLRRSDPAAFDAYLRDVYDPASPAFRKFLTPGEIDNIRTRQLKGRPGEGFDRAWQYWLRHAGFPTDE